MTGGEVWRAHPAWPERSVQKLAPSPDVVNIQIAMLLEHSLGHTTSRAAGAADNHRHRLGDLCESARQFLQRYIDRPRRIRTGKLPRRSHVNQDGTVLLEFGQHGHDFA